MSLSMSSTIRAAWFMVGFSNSNRLIICLIYDCVFVFELFGLLVLSELSEN